MLVIPLDSRLGKHVVKCERVSPGVIPDIEGDEVEPEHLDQPDHVVEIAANDHPSRLPDQGSLDGAEVVEQLRRATIPLRATVTGCPHPFPHQGDHLAVGFTAVALRQLAGELGKRLGTSGMEGVQLVWACNHQLRYR